MFTATIEYVTPTRAIISLFDSSGEWTGAQRLDLPRNPRESLYDAGYARASQMAAVKGGTISRFSEET